MPARSSSTTIWSGDLTLTYGGLELTAEPGLSFLIYTADPGSDSQQRLDLLASWAASRPDAGVAVPIELDKETRP